MTTASAPGKIILFGEHAVVYKRPAIAVPVVDVSATATIVDLPPGSGCTLIAHDLGVQARLATAAEDDPLALVLRLALNELGLPPDPDWNIEIRSQIPMAGGLGSGAAVSTALVRAAFLHAGQEPVPAAVSRLVYHSEELHHGTPSGIDNTVIAYAKPIWFVRGEPIQTFTPARPFTIVIADSGISSPTWETVGDVRRAWQQDPVRYEAIFDRIGETVQVARQAIERGEIEALGSLMKRNQALLEEIGVSSDPLRRLIQAAEGAGAAGAKLSGGGRGGNVIALVDESSVHAVSAALTGAGARRVIVTSVGEDGRE
jgi:mevalonate kinase